MRFKTGFAALIAALAITVTGASSASAATYHYCSSCKIYNNSWVYVGSNQKLTSNYVHYLGSGNRWMGAGAQGWGTSWDWNEVTRYYGGAGLFNGAAGFSGSNSYATSNAHINYIF